MTARDRPVRTCWTVAAVAASLLGLQTVSAQVPVEAESLSSIRISITRSVPAEVISLREATVASQLTSTVTELPVLVGDRVRQDSLLARLDCEDSQLQLKHSQAELLARETIRAFARQKLERLEKLRLSNSTTEDELNQKQGEVDVVEARIQAQKIAIRIAQRQVGKCVIRAPFGGIITEVLSEVGNFVVPGTQIASIVDTDNIELSARINPVELDQAMQSEQLTFQYADQGFPVAIRTTLEVIDAISQSRLMRLNFLDRKPLPGSSGRLLWDLRGSYLPSSLMVTRNGVQGVFVVSQADSAAPVARFVALPDASPGQPAKLDLAPSTLIVTDGRHALVDGASVILE